MDKDQIETELNTNKATQAYAKTITAPIKTSKGEFTLSPNTDANTKDNKPFLVTKK
jgi:hypothetical protein